MNTKLLKRLAEDYEDYRALCGHFGVYPHNSDWMIHYGELKRQLKRERWAKNKGKNKFFQRIFNFK